MFTYTHTHTDAFTGIHTRICRISYTHSTHIIVLQMPHCYMHANYQAIVTVTLATSMSDIDYRRMHVRCSHTIYRVSVHILQMTVELRLMYVCQVSF